MEKDLAISSEKLSNFIEKIKFFEEKNSNESEKHSSEILELKTAFSK